MKELKRNRLTDFIDYRIMGIGGAIAWLILIYLVVTWYLSIPNTPL